MFKIEKNKLKFHKEVEDALVNYSWPGNVRELENLMERLTILCESDTVYLEDLPLKILKDPNLSKSKEHVNDSG